MPIGDLNVRGHPARFGERVNADTIAAEAEILLRLLARRRLACSDLWADSRSTNHFKSPIFQPRCPFKRFMSSTSQSLYLLAPSRFEIPNSLHRYDLVHVPLLSGVTPMSG